MEISLDEFIRQWTLGKPKVNQLQFNIGEFVTYAGIVSQEFFKKSFSYGGFYGSGQKWEPRKSRWGKRFNHKIMLDSNKLKNGIKSGNKLENARPVLNKRGRTGFKHAKAWIYISTTETYSPEGKKRGKKRGNSNANYAAIHNMPQSITPFYVNQHYKDTSKPRPKPVQRQFIGRSLLLDAEVSKLYDLIFTDFPHD